jgi:hypothetical protein
MSEDEELSHLVGTILDATLDPALWTPVLAGISQFVNGQAGGLLSKDAVSKAGTAHYHYGVDPHYMQIYVETYFRLTRRRPCRSSTSGRSCARGISCLLMNFARADSIRSGCGPKAGSMRPRWCWRSR